MLFHKLLELFFFKWRQTRISSIIWTISLVGVSLLTASAFSGMYQNQQERQAIAETMENPAMIAMVGPGYGIEDYTNGAMMAHQMLLFTAIVLAIMSILLVAKMTRKEEEEGKYELIRSLPVGRLSGLSASLILVSLLNVAIGLLTAIGLIAIDVEGMDIQGSILYGATLAAAGLIFTGITAIISQLMETSRATIGLSIGILLFCYLMRAIGDVSSEMLSLISPLGLLIRTEVYVDNYWWPIVVILLLFLIFIIIAFYLNNIRDVGAGLLPSKPGKQEASKWLLSPIGLILRLQRTAIISWLCAMLLIGVSYGSVFGDLESFFEGNEVVKQMLGSDPEYTLTEQFITMLMVVLAILATVPAILIFLKIRGEEKKERNEHLLTRGVSRYQLLAHYFILAIVIGVLSLFLAIFGLWMTATNVMVDPIPLTNLLKAGMAYIPAMLIILILATFLFGFLPRWTPLVWMYLVYSFFTVYLGGLLDMPAWVANISSFSHIPQLPVEEFSWKPIEVLLVICIISAILSFIGYRKRDALG